MHACFSVRMRNKRARVQAPLLRGLRACMHADNIFLKHKDDFSSVKIGDFGLSKESNLRMKAPCGTIQYCAPEMLLEPCRYSNAVDIWSAGLVLIQLLVGFHPFAALRSLDFYRVVKDPKKANLILSNQRRL